MKKIMFFIFILLMPFNVLAYSDYIIPGGNNIGINVNSKGILIVGFYKIDNKYNKGDLKIGDYILEVAGKRVTETKELVDLIDKYEVDGSVDLKILRENKEFNTKLTLVKSKNIYKTGLYVKDSISGIGTLTYIDPETKIYGALGHEIIESNSKKRIEVKNGSIFKSEVTSIDRSFNGNPGTKNAKFYNGITFGDVKKNTIHGIYGTYFESIDKTPIKVGQKDDIVLGNASILTVTNKNKIESYNIKITKIDKTNKVKNIYFEITDKGLLEKTGGIVQGMSGSPIIQDNKIIGAVTHVVVENVKKGYGIFITTMLEEGEN